MIEKLTEEENNCLSLLGLSWNSFLELPNYHPDDIKEFRQHIHALQNIVSARVAKRCNPETFNIKP